MKNPTIRQLCLLAGACLGLLGLTAATNVLENPQFQGAAQSDLNMGAHNITNAGTVSATNLVLNGTNITTLPASITNDNQIANGAGYATTNQMSTSSSAAQSNAVAIAQTNAPVQSVNGQTGAVTLSLVTNDNQIGNGAGYQTAAQVTAATSNLLAINGSGAGLTNIHGATAATSYSAAQSFTLNVLGRTSSTVLNLGAGTVPYAVAATLSDTGAQNGDIYNVTMSWPASANPTVTFNDSGTGAGIAGPFLGTTTAASTTVSFCYYSGTGWIEMPKGEVVKRNLGTGTYGALTNAAGQPGGVAVVGSGGALTNTVAGSAVTGTVASATTAATSTNAQTATYATSAGSSTNAQSATYATSAGSATNVPAAGVTSGTFGSNVLEPYSQISSAPLITPYTPGTPWIWADARRFNGTANGASISSIPDAAGSSNSMTCTGITYAQNGINGLPAFVFAGTSGSYMTTSASLDSTWNSAFTIVLVERCTGLTTNGADQGLFGGTDDKTYADLYASQSSGIGNGTIYTVFNSATDGGNAISLDPSSSFNVIIISYDGTTIRWSENGIEHYELAASTSVNEATPLVFGNNELSGSFYNHFAGDMAEILVYKQGWSVQTMREQGEMWNDAYNGPKNQTLCVGDSITSGIETALPNQSYPSYLASYLGATNFNVINLGIPGYTTEQLATLSANRELAGLRFNGAYAPIINYWAGTNNNATEGESVATIETQISTNCQALRNAGAKVVFVDILPRGSTAGWETNRQAVNAWAEANWATFADGFADVGADPTIGAAGSQTNTTYYYSDQTHMVGAGNQIAARIIGNADKHLLAIPVQLTGTMASGTCTITNDLLVPGMTLGAPAFTGTNTTNPVGNPYMTSWTPATNGAPGTVTILSQTNTTSGTVAIPVQP